MFSSVLTSEYSLYSLAGIGWAVHARRAHPRVHFGASEQNSGSEKVLEGGCRLKLGTTVYT